MIRPRSLALAFFGFSVALTGCDSIGTPPEAAALSNAKMRLWGETGPAPGAVVAKSALALTDSVDFFVTFVASVADPEPASDEVFSEQDVRRRGYVMESAPGVAATVSVREFDALMAVLEASPLVAWVEPDVTVSAPELLGSYVPLSHRYTGQPTDATVGTAEGTLGTFEGQMLPWNVTLIGGDRSSARSGDGSGAVDVDVYVIDSGVDHPDVTVVEAVKFFDDELGDGPTTHGNHVAATIAATDDGRGMVGVAPGARIHSLDVFDARGTATMSRMIAAVDYVTAAKRANPSRPIVVNMSVGAHTGTSALNALDEAVQASIAAGVVYVVSAGNQRVDAAHVSPAHVPGVLTVGAYDSNGAFALDFSNYGPTVDLMAPGVRVVSAADAGRYAILDGTSMAAPHVAGAAALYLAKNPTATQAQVAAALQAAGRDMVVIPGYQTTRRSVWVGGL